MTGERNRPIVLGPGEGRHYPMGALNAVFKADEAETACAYSISEWWLDPHTPGPGAHSHEEDDIFYVIEGTLRFLVGDDWIDAPKGTFIRAAGGVVHDFANETDQRAGFLNLSFPGGFEREMPGIAAWFTARTDGTEPPP
jgi:quercetin dioxygenase-like cupin family protein